MALETAAHLSGLVATNPAGGDDLSQGDDHLRMIKQVLLTDLPLDAPASALGMNILKSATPDAVRGLLSASTDAFKNRITNGDFSIENRRDISVISGAALKYVVDRFYGYCNGVNTNIYTASNPYAPSMNIAGVTGLTGAGVGTRLQSADTYDLAGNNATLSFSLKITSGTTNVIWSIYYANTFETFGTLLSPTRTLIGTGSVTATTTNTNFSNIVSIPLGATTGLEVVLSVGALANGVFLQITNMQLEKGAISSSNFVFEKVDVPLQQSRCEHYYQRFTGNDGLMIVGSGHQNSTTASRIAMPIRKMRKLPNVSFSGSVLLDIAGATSAATLSTQYNSLNSVAFDVTHAAVGAAGSAVMLQLPNSINNYIEIDAEMYT